MVFPTRRIIQNKSVHLGIVALFIGLGLAAVDTIWSAYLDTFFHSVAFVGFLSGILSLIAVISYLFSSTILEKYPETKLWLIGTAATIISYLLFAIVHSASIFLGVAVFLVIMSIIRIIAFGIIVRDVNAIESIGSAEGMVYALSNVGWLLGPLIAGFILTKLGYGPVFLFGAIFFACALLIFLSMRVKSINHHTHDDGTIKGSINNLKEFFSKKKFRKAYVISGGISLYWGIIYTYLPLFIIRSNLPLYWVGLFLFAIGVPLALLEYQIGKLADKKGLQQFFIIGYSVLAVASIAAFFFSSIYIIMGIFVLASFGAACLEGTRESYFFQITKQSEEQKYYGPYLTHMDVFGTIGKLACAAALALFAQQYFFLLLGAMMLFFVWRASVLEKAF